MSRLLAIAFLLLSAFVSADAQTPPAQETLKVGVVELPPVVTRDADGTWRGIGVEVWQQIAQKLNLKYEIVSFTTHDQLSAAIVNGSVDLAIPSIPVSAINPQTIQFTQPYFASSFAAAVAPSRWRITWFNSLHALISAGVFEFALALVALLAFGGLIIWICERRRNPGEFGGSVVEGLGHGIWWSAVTMTTVGYGDKAPRTVIGRIFAMIWMFVGFVLLSLFVSALVSNINSQIDQGNDAMQDLRVMRVGAVADTPSLDFLQARSIPAKSYNTISEMMEAFRNHQLDAVFSDAVHLRHASWKRLGFVPQIVSQSGGCNWYAFALKSGNPIDSQLNDAILEFIQQPKWDEIVSSQTGPYLMNDIW